MATDYSTLGFPVEKLRHLKKLAKKVLPLATEVSGTNGKFLCWAPGSGEELWFKRNDRDQVFRVSVHFSGSSRVRVGLTEAIWPDDGADDTSVRGPILVRSPPTGCASSSTPLTDRGIPTSSSRSSLQHRSQPSPARSRFTTSRTRRRNRLRRPPFLRVRSRRARPRRRISPVAVVDSAIRTNSLTGKHYVWASAKTLGGLYDVVVRPILLTEPPAPGALVTETFGLSRRLLDETGSTG